MIEKDTVRLLKECDAGVKMGISSISDSVRYVKNPELKGILEHSLDEHKHIKEDMQKLLDQYHDDGKEPAVMAKTMEWFKTKVTLAVDPSDDAVADFITDGCNMGIKSLSRYLNQYKAADEKSKDISKKLIREEDHLSTEVRQFL
ncbi:MAG: hypothetical protein IKK47_01350 [Ruminococcus sp.]|nr:hypothetical protein [Ruminococcus sp.]